MYVSYKKCQSTCVGYIAGIDGNEQVDVRPDYLLGNFTAYGNGSLAYGIDTVLWRNGVRTGCALNNPIVADRAGNIFAVTGTYTNANIVSIVPAGDSCSEPVLAHLNRRGILAMDRADHLYVWDMGSIYRMDHTTHALTRLIASDCMPGFPIAMAATSTGDFFLTDGSSVVRQSLVSGGACVPMNIPGLNSPVGLAVDSRGNLYVADSGSNQVLRVNNAASGNCAPLATTRGSCGDAAYFAVSAPTADLCYYGTASAVSSSATGPWTWTCTGQNYGRNVSCSTYPAVLTVTAAPATMIQGGPVPAFVPAYSGFVNGDRADYLYGAPAFSTAATASSPPGTYPITVTQGTLDSEGYYTFAFTPGTLSVVAPPKVQLSLSAAVTREATGYRAVVTVKNTGGADAANVLLTTATLAAAAGSPLPQSLGLVRAGTNAQAVVTFPLSAGAAGASVVARFAGAYTGGTFSSSIRVTLP